MIADLAAIKFFFKKSEIFYRRFDPGQNDRELDILNRINVGDANA